MIKDPVVPLSPSLLPQQRLYEVKALMTWPSSVLPVVGNPGELGVPNLPGGGPDMRSACARRSGRGRPTMTA
jgi:hypothetical protein